MRVFLGLNPSPPATAYAVITQGAFDGIHRGHQKLIDRVNSVARQRNGTGILVTFEPHPQRVIAPGTAPPLLTTREEKLLLLEATGLETVVILPFNRELSDVEAEDFVRDVLVKTLGVKFLILGHDHAFGLRRGGRPELLRKMAPELGFDLEIVEAVTDNGEAITSTLIRRVLTDGGVESARVLLGRPYSLQGLVIKGDRRGTNLGFPTANLALRTLEKCVPGNGVYAVQSKVRDRIYGGACSIGTRPTFTTDTQTVEVHLFDFDDDIYGEYIEVMFHARLRDEEAFTGPEALRKQIENDVMEAKRILAQEGN